MSVSQSASELPDQHTSPGAKYVGPVGMFAVAAFLILMVVLCLCGLVILWPTPIPAGPTSSYTEDILLSSLDGLPAEGLEPTRPCGHWILSPALYQG
jgi:hypothetical protein